MTNPSDFFRARIDAMIDMRHPLAVLGNRTPWAMIVDKYRSKERLPVALRSSGTESEEVRIESEPAIQIAKTGAAPSSCERSSAT